MLSLGAVVSVLVHREMGHLLILIAEHAKYGRAESFGFHSPFGVTQVAIYARRVERLAYTSLVVGFAVLYATLVAVVWRGLRTLKTQVKRFGALVECLAEGLMVLDAEQCITYANARLGQLFGYPAEKLIGRDWREFLATERGALRWIGDLRCSVPPEGLDFETMLVREDGTHWRACFHVSLFRWTAAHSDGVLCSLTDVTDRWRAQAAVTSAHSELQRQFGELEMTKKQLQVANEQLQHDAFHDSLTGLPNRALLMDRLNRAVERNKRHPHLSFGLLFIDFDRFKTINDTLGHVVGDKLLIAIGERLLGCVRDSDTVARLGGDEFTILLGSIDGLGEAGQVAERVQQAFARPVFIGADEIRISAGIGVVESWPGFDSAAKVLRAADIAMYRAKSERSSKYQVFNDAMHQEATRMLALESGIGGALQRGELHVQYQPIVALADGRLTGFEALLRWTHPVYGSISPTDFIPIAEETLDIIALDRWVLREACAQMVTWQRENSLRNAFSISVNLSGQQFSRKDLVHCVHNALLETGLDPARLKLEVTETTLLQSSETVQNTLEWLQGLGVQLSIDDFGTGYASLQYLQSFPANVLKIDHCFVDQLGNDPETWKLVQTIITMGKQLNLQIVAEGVETEEQLSILQNLGCHFGQGYFFSRPLSAEEAKRHISNGRGEEHVEPLGTA